MYLIHSLNSAGNAAVNIRERVQGLKFSHLLFKIKGTALIATELPKLTLNCKIQPHNRNIVDSVGLLNLCMLSDINGGVGFDSTIQAYAYLPIGTMDTTACDFILEVTSSSNLGANAFAMDIYACLDLEDAPVLEYEQRTIAASTSTPLVSVLQVYDVATAENSTKNTLITFDNSSQITVPHKMAYVKNQCISKLESVNVFGQIYSDKDMTTGRNLVIKADTAFTALIISLSALNQ